VLLPSDTHRKPITSITDVSLPFVTYLVTPLYNVPGYILDVLVILMNNVFKLYKLNVMILICGSAELQNRAVSSKSKALAL
jgi:hypothetical protein